MQQNEFRQRRERLLAAVGEGNIALLASASPRTRNRDVRYPFRQDSDFYYLTGFNEADALAVFAPGHGQGEYLLFCREFDAQQALWEGAHAGLHGAVTDHHADAAFPIAEADKLLPGLLEGKRKVFYPMGEDSGLDLRIQDWLRQVRAQNRRGASAPSELVALGSVLHEMRLIKSPAELALMRRAAAVSAQAQLKAMLTARPGLYEYHIEAELLYHFGQSGLRAVAYPPIVASGDNACTLHYTANRGLLRDGDLLLIDAGAECDHYAADITRTFPVSGRFSAEQATLYRLVLEAQAAALANIQPGAPCIAFHQAAVEVLTRGLVELGLLSGRVKTLIKKEKYKAFYPHRTGHWLGMDVHDVGDYKQGGQWRPLAPGMVLTVEPGLYVPSQCPDVDPKWRGIGIRVEDAVLVTEDGHEVLTIGAPKGLAEIEGLMQGRPCASTMT